MKTYVWSIPTRAFHWLLVLGIIVSFISIEVADSISIHVISGLTIGIIILFRLLWGATGPRYSHFKDFVINPRTIIEYLKNSNGKLYVGHNPLASVVMLGIVVVVLLMVMSGIMLLESSSETALFFSINSAHHELLMEIHEVLFSVLMVLTGMHILGLILDRVKNREAGTLMSIFTGYKTIEGENIKLNTGQRFIAIVFGVLLVLSLILMSSSKKIISIQLDDQDTEMVDED
ncbi:MAG: cytochrome b/b6 domain-containing protein [Bacteroidales bacterium]